MSNPTKEDFLKFVKEMTSGSMGAAFEGGAHADKAMAKRIVAFDPHLAKLVTTAADARLEVMAYLKGRSEGR